MNYAHLIVSNLFSYGKFNIVVNIEEVSEIRDKIINELDAFFFKRKIVNNRRIWWGKDNSKLIVMIEETKYGFHHFKFELVDNN